MTFYTGGSERMRLDTSGNLGIGTTPSGARLDILTAAGTAAIQKLQTGSNAAAATLIFGQIGSVGWNTGITATAGDYQIAIDGGQTAYTATRSGISVTNHIFSTGGTERMRIDSSGNVGIGRAPNYTLDVYRSGTTTPTIAAANDNIVNVLRASGSTEAVIGPITSHPLVLLSANTERMRIDATGNVGIGTASPSGNLQVSGANPRIRFSNTNGTASTLLFGADSGQMFLGAETNAPIYFITNNTERMRIDSSGNVGIGTASPGTTLEVFTGSTTNGIRIKRFTGNYYSELRQVDSPEGLAFLVGDGSTVAERMRITGTGNVIAGSSAALATNATDGFLYVPTCAGTPTGTPTAITGMAPIVVNTTNNKLYFYSGGAWRDAGP